MRSRTVAAAATTLVLVVAGSALAGSLAPTKTRAFTATYAGRAIVRASSDTTADINATGAGKGNVIGASKLSAVGSGFSGEPCAVFSGKGTLSGKLGKLTFTVSPGAKACPEAGDANKNAVTASMKLTGGTLAFKKARGTLKVTGTYDRGTGKFTATLKGSISM